MKITAVLIKTKGDQMRKVILSVVLAGFVAAPVHANPIGALGRFAKGRVRDAKDLVLFKHPLVTTAFILSVGASAADAKTTADAGRRGGVERNAWLFGQKPGFHRVFWTEVAIDTAFGLNNVALANYAKKNNISWGKYVAPLSSVPLIIGYSTAAAHNTGVCSPIVCK